MILRLLTFPTYELILQFVFTYHVSLVLEHLFSVLQSFFARLLSLVFNKIFFDSEPPTRAHHVLLPFLAIVIQVHNN
jgi:hypothetical protein